MLYSFYIICTPSLQREQSINFFIDTRKVFGKIELIINVVNIVNFSGILLLPFQLQAAKSEHHVVINFHVSLRYYKPLYCLLRPYTVATNARSPCQVFVV